MGHTLFNEAVKTFASARKDGAEYNEGKADVYEARAREQRGEINFFELMREEGAANKRARDAQLGSIGKTILGAVELTPYLLLPQLFIVDYATNLPKKEGKEAIHSEGTRDPKDKKLEACLVKEKKEQQQDYSEEQESAGINSSEARIHEVKAGDSIWKIVEADYRLHHNNETNNQIINERTKALVAKYGETIHAGNKIELPPLTI